MTTASQSKAVPTEIELMAYFDGELDEVRALEVERYLESSESSRKKLDGLSVLGSWVRAQQGEAYASGSESAGSSLGEGFTDALMARLETESAGGGVVPSSRETVGRIAPANDNARLLWGLVAAAAAAAAGLFFWGKGMAGLDDSQMARAVGVPAVSQSSEALAPSPSSTATTPPSDDDSTGMEIAAIDFGSATGAIYYVPKGDNLVGAATTTVVWLADE